MAIEQIDHALRSGSWCDVCRRLSNSMELYVHVSRDWSHPTSQGRRSSGAQAFPVEYRGCINVNERFPRPGEMQPAHFTRLADGIEAAVLAQTKKQVKKSAKLWKKGKLTFDTTNNVRAEAHTTSVLATI